MPTLEDSAVGFICPKQEGLVELEIGMQVESQGVSWECRVASLFWSPQVMVGHNYPCFMKEKWFRGREGLS